MVTKECKRTDCTRTRWGSHSYCGETCAGLDGALSKERIIGKLHEYFTKCINLEKENEKLKLLINKQV